MTQLPVTKIWSLQYHNTTSTLIVNRVLADGPRHDGYVYESRTEIETSQINKIDQQLTS